jgi:formylglycine-generating enzyme required for sulfatase activity
MDDFAELEIDLTSPGAMQCQVQLRYRPPGSQSEIRLGLLNGAPASPVIDLGQLGDKTLDDDAYARALTQALFSQPALAQSFSESLAAAANTTLRIRLWIDSSTSPLHDVCWELLLNPKDGTRLSAGERILFSRGLSTLSALPVTLKAPEEAVALLAVANPEGLAAYKLAPIDVGAELARARSNLAGLGAIRCLPDGKDQRVSLDNLFAAITPGVELLYLVCHGTLAGDDAWLWLEDPNGAIKRISATDFVERIRGLPAYPEMVILMSCQSAGSKSGRAWRALGPRLVNAGIPVVLAMQGDFSMESEAAFMPHFFQSLREHGEADRALSYARAFIAERHDCWMPALFSHLRDNRIFARSSPQALPTLKLLAYEPETVYIPAGQFWMGSDDPDAPDFEKPCHSVDLPSFRIGKYPLTNRQYAEFIRQSKRIAPPEMGWSGQNPPADKLDHPVQGVTWYEALEYCQWLSEKTGRLYALPSEAQWEKAARGQDKRRYPWGSDWDPARLAPTGEIMPVNAVPAQSVYGCHAMVANVREWTASLWGQNRSQPDPGSFYPWAQDGRNDLTANKLIRRVIRGAGHNDAPASCTCFARNAAAPDKPGPPGNRHGFRVIMAIQS